MAASDIAARMTFEATTDIKEHYKHLWQKYLQSIEDGKPVFYLPKDIADWLGNATVEDMARRFGKKYENSMVIAYDRQLECFLIGPDEYVDDDLRIFKHVPLEESMLVQTPSLQTAGLLRTPNRVQTRTSHIARNLAQISPVKSPKIPKPPNSWILYRQSKHAGVVAQNPGIHNSQISVIISKMWQNETAEVKASFKKKANDEKQRLLQEYPDWKCSPRKSSQIKKRNKITVTSPNSNVREEVVSGPSPSWDHQVPGMSGTSEYYGIVKDHDAPSAFNRNFANTLPVLDPTIAAQLENPFRPQRQHYSKTVNQFDILLQGFLS